MHWHTGPTTSIMSISDQDASSTRPYLIRALHEWCVDNGFSPHLAVHVDGGVQVPQEYVKNGEIVLNVSLDATSSLRLGNDFIEFKARFGGKARDIVVPVTHVVAIYARENGQGMAFPAPVVKAVNPPEVPLDAVARGPLRSVPLEGSAPVDTGGEPPHDGSGRGVGRPQLKRIK